MCQDTAALLANAIQHVKVMVRTQVFVQLNERQHPTGYRPSTSTSFNVVMSFLAAVVAVERGVGAVRADVQGGLESDQSSKHSRHCGKRVGPFGSDVGQCVRTAVVKFRCNFTSLECCSRLVDERVH